MAFPTSPSNNDVHKEGNRAFVYDSTLGVWDQVKESDRLFGEAGGGVIEIEKGTVGSGVTFPAGHVIQVKGTDNYHTQNFDADYDIVVELNLTNVLASSHVAIWTTMTINFYHTGAEGLETYVFSHTSSMGSVGDDASNKRRINATGGNMGEATFSYVGHGGNIAFYHQVPYWCVDTAPATGDNFYCLAASAFDNTPEITHAGNCSILLMEIAQ